jgi:hypothetical protein
MNVREARVRLERSTILFGARVYRAIWDFLASLQSPEKVKLHFLLWTSPADASRMKSSTPLKPYVCRVEQATLIEPRHGFAVADWGQLIETSVSNGFAARDPFLRQFFNLPSPANYFIARVLGRYRTDLESVVLLPTNWPHNYFHFYRDFLPKILLLEQANIEPSVPVVVPDDLIDQPFFQQAIRSERLARWNFISPRGQFIKTESLVFCSANQFIVMDRSDAPDPELLRHAKAGTKFLESPAEVLALLGLDDLRTQAGADRRVFLTRSGLRGRTISNYDELEPLLREKNFETVETEGLSLREQAQLFSECRYLIGIHGAGLTNIVWAHDHDLSLIQLRQPGEEHLLTDFALMCYSYGFDHEEIFGTAGPKSRGWAPMGPGNRNGSFHIDPGVLRAAIDRMLVPSPPATAKSGPTGEP